MILLYFLFTLSYIVYFLFCINFCLVLFFCFVPISCFVLFYCRSSLFLNYNIPSSTTIETSLVCYTVKCLPSTSQAGDMYPQRHMDNKVQTSSKDDHEMKFMASPTPLQFHKCKYLDTKKSKIKEYFVIKVSRLLQPSSLMKIFHTSKHNREHISAKILPVFPGLILHKKTPYPA